MTPPAALCHRCRYRQDCNGSPFIDFLGLCADYEPGLPTLSPPSLASHRSFPSQEALP